MRYLYIIFLTISMSSCRHSQFTDISGTVSGLNSGTMVIKDDSGNTKFTENIEEGKFHFKKTLSMAGYYRMRIIDDGARDTRITGYDVFLEPGDYTLNALPESAHQYPVIKTSSTTQTQLSDYYSIANAKTLPYSKEIERYTTAINSGKLAKQESLETGAKLDGILKLRDSVMGEALKEYIEKYPQSAVAAHLMYLLPYESMPEVYYPIYKKFSNEEQKSPEGVEEGDKLGKLSQLIPGAEAPQLLGKTPDGKDFDPKSLNKKIILVEFWRADDKLSRTNHYNLVNGFGSPVKNMDFTVISVSLYTDPAIWRSAISEDKMKWPQLCDLKGQDSPNMSNWQISELPTYYLLDGNWKIIKRQIHLKDVPAAIKKMAL